MPESKEYLDCFEEIANSKKYGIIQHYFKGSGCVNSELIGSVSTMCRQSGAKNFKEWYRYYHKTPYANNLNVGVTRLQCALKKDGWEYNDEDVLMCLKTFVLYQTWIGMLQEKRIKYMLEDENFYCLFSDAKNDIEYNVDLLLVSKKQKKWVCGLQVKPASYKEIEFDRTRTMNFHKKYNIPMLYIRYYTDTKDYFEMDLLNVKCLKELILRSEKASV